MTNEELNTALYKKMFAEQEQYKEWLLTQPPDEILNHAYEYTTREDILLSLENSNEKDFYGEPQLKHRHPQKDQYEYYEIDYPSS